MGGGEIQLAADSFIQILSSKWLIKWVNDAGDRLNLKPSFLGLKGAPLIFPSPFFILYFFVCSWYRHGGERRRTAVDGGGELGFQRTMVENELVVVHALRQLGFRHCPHGCSNKFLDMSPFHFTVIYHFALPIPFFVFLYMYLILIIEILLLFNFVLYIIKHFYIHAI